VITKGYRLPARYVIQAVGPSWHGVDNGESELLARTYRRCLALAEDHGVRTMALPAISCGLYSFPARIAAPIAIRETRSAMSRSTVIEKVIFALFTPEVFAAFEAAMQEPQLIDA
jgi:O-acetyl-ADP-ribose deacetylase (regulator of RNase III)